MGSVPNNVSAIDLTGQTLLGVDWADAWRKRDSLRKPPDEAAIWDERATEFTRQSRHSGYARDFLDLLDLSPGQQVMDMGAGSGALAIPLAKLGHEVLAVDISAGMLAELEGQASEEGVSERIHCINADFNSSLQEWLAAGIDRKSADVCIASRSTMVADLARAFAQLEAIARERVVVTMATEHGPRHKRELGQIIDGQPFIPDYVFGLNILLAAGRFPCLSKIDSYKEQRLIRWAFVSWEVPNGAA
jgi:SAM-dependent methyltransferase